MISVNQRNVPEQPRIGLSSNSTRYRLETSKDGKRFVNIGGKALVALLELSDMERAALRQKLSGLKARVSSMAKTPQSVKMVPAILIQISIKPTIPLT